MKFIKELNLKKYNAYDLNVLCSKAWFPEKEEELIELFKNNSDSKRIILGNGNNIILSKEYYDEEFIILNGCYDRIEIKENIIIAEAGATLQEISEVAMNNSLSGLEIFYDIPSSIGGAVVMNAGTKDGEIKDVLLKVRYLDLSDYVVKEISKDDIGFEYRNSIFQKDKDKVVLKAWFKLQKGDKEEIKTKMEQYKERRWVKQPREFPNCGSVFKRPKDRFVGPMIDELGLKGFTIGGAKISEKHGGFIVNFNNASGKDILEIIRIVKQKVMEKFNVDLEIEQRII